MKRIAALMAFLMLAAASQAATFYYYIVIPKTSVWFTASTYQPNRLVANTVWTGFSLSNSGCPVSLSCVGSTAHRYIYQLTVYNVPAGYDTYAIVRQNSTGQLAYTGHGRANSPTSVVFLGTASFGSN